MIKYLKKYWIWCILAPVSMFGEILIDLLQPEMMSDIVDNGVLKQDIDLIINVGIKMILLVLFGGFCGIMAGVFANLASQQFGNDLRKDVFKKIMNLSFQQTDKISTGSLVTRLTNDVTQLQNMVGMSLRGMVRSGIMFAGGIVMLSRQSYKFAVIAVCAAPFIVIFIYSFLKKSSPLFTEVQRNLDNVNNVMQENVAGSRVVKAYVREEYEQQRFDNANSELCGTNLKVQTILAFMSPCMNIVLNLCVVAIILVGGITVKNGGAMSTGKIMAAITYIALILNSMLFMANIFQTFARAKASAARINEVLNSEEIIKDGCMSTKADGTIEFKNVSFSYPNSSGNKVLEDISFKVRKGETLAILGATGSGKSSLVNLIPRFYDADTGEVLVDGINVKDYKLKDLREKIAIVMQKAELYSRPIEANIRWGKSEATPFEIKKAAQIAQADEFICAKPSGYYTQVTEGGHSLSGGQKQRISISRAVLKNSEILIFDDSTSALDLKTEAELYKALKTECPDTTKIIIAQRIASVKGADRILVIDHGRVAACGNHDELMETSAIYQDIYNSQLKKEK